MLSPYVATKSQTHNLHMHTRYILPVRTTKGVWVISQPTYAYKIYLWAEYPNKRRKRSQPTYAYKIYRENRNRFGGIITLTTYICIQDISLHQHRKRERKPLTTYICREYLLFYIRNLCILSRLKDAEPPLISVRISYVFFVCFSFALLIFKVFSIMSSIFFIPIF